MPEPVRRDWCEEHNRGDLSATDGLCPDCEAQAAAAHAATPDPLAGLSTNARKLLERVRDPRNWYPAYGSRTPKAMAELEEAGLVRRGSRMPVVNTYFVPAGYEMSYRERFPDDGFVDGTSGRSYYDGPTQEDS